MIKKTIVFDGYDGKKYSEDYYFHMTKADLAEMKLYLEETGLDEYFKKISASSKASEVLPHFKDIIRKAIGRMSEDGKRFDKRDGDVWLEFTQTEAYSEFFMWLLENAEEAAKFFTGILPAGLTDKVEEALAQNQLKLPIPDDETDVTTNAPPTFDDYTREELMEMPKEKFEGLVGTELHLMTKAQLIVATQRLAREKHTEAKSA